MRGPWLIHLWGRLTHCCEEKMESVNQFAKLRNWRSESTVIKSSQSLLKCPRSLHLLLPSTQMRSLCWKKQTHCTYIVCVAA